jgi:hypothetical protein
MLVEFIPYRLMRNQPNELRKKLEEQGELVVTVDGEPMAIMLQIPRGSLEDLVLLVSQVRAQLAVAKIRQNARQTGKDKISEEEADYVVQETRAKRRKKRGK